MSVLKLVFQTDYRLRCKKELSYCCAQYVFKVNGKVCETTLKRSVIGFQESKHSKYYSEFAAVDDVTIEGICTGVPKGYVSVSVSVECCNGKCDEQPAKILSGFSDGSRIEIFEIGKAW